MTSEGSGSSADIYPYLLLEAWPRAWEKNKGRVVPYGALPGLLLAIESPILSPGDPYIRAGNYWNSKLRADVNLSFWRAEAAEWLRQVPVFIGPVIVDARTRIYVTEQAANTLSGVLVDAAWVFGNYNVEIVKERFAQDRESPDLKWWIVTLEGEKALRTLGEEIKAAKEEQKRRQRGMGFRS